MNQSNVTSELRGNWGERIRAIGDEAIKIAKAESSPDEPLWLCRFGDPAFGWHTCIPAHLAPKLRAGRTQDLYLPIGRVGWCVIGDAFGVERIVEGPFATHDEAYCKLATWSAARAKAGFAQVQVDFYVGIRHTPETFWGMVRRMDSERQAAKAARHASGDNQ